MNYIEAENQISQYSYLIGKPLLTSEIKYLIISTKDKLAEVVNLYYRNGYDNKKALSELGLIDNDDLAIFLMPPKYTSGHFFSDLESYLSTLDSKSA